METELQRLQQDLRDYQNAYEYDTQALKQAMKWVEKDKTLIEITKEQIANILSKK